MGISVGVSLDLRVGGVRLILMSVWLLHNPVKMVGNVLTLQIPTTVAVPKDSLVSLTFHILQIKFNKI